MAIIYAGAGVTYGTGSGTEGDPYNIKQALETLNPSDVEVMCLAGTHTTQIYNNAQSLWTFPSAEVGRMTMRGEPGATIIKCFGGTNFSVRNNCQYFTWQDLIFDGDNMSGSTAPFTIVEQDTSHTMVGLILQDVTFRYGNNHNCYIDYANSGMLMQDVTSYDAGQNQPFLVNNIYAGARNSTYRRVHTYYTSGHPNSYGKGYAGLRVYVEGSAINALNILQSDGQLVEDCLFERGIYGLTAGGGDDQIIRNNVFSNNQHSGLPGVTGKCAGVYFLASTAYTQNNIKVLNNTIEMQSAPASSAGVYAQTFTSASLTNPIIKNIISYGPTDIIDSTQMTGLVSSNNISTNPNFIAPGSDWHIEEGSTADGTGATLADVTDDRDGLSRPQDGVTYCIGAYEVPNPFAGVPVNQIQSSYGATVNVAADLNLSVTHATGDISGSATSNAGVWLKTDDPTNVSVS